MSFLDGVVAIQNRPKVETAGNVTKAASDARELRKEAILALMDDHLEWTIAELNTRLNAELSTTRTDVNNLILGGRIMSHTVASTKYLRIARL